LATNIIHPNHTLEPGDLDAFLERGWRPTGQSIYTSDYLRTDDDELHGCVQIRLPLQDFTFKKRHRKLLKRNGRRFRLVHEPVAGMPDQELLNVNRLYMADHPEKTREDLEYNVINDLGQRVLNTQVLRVYDRHRLAAFSYFDVGRRVMYTKTGIYDPEYKSHSLGLYTMLLEVEMALERGYDYYYPGYYSPSFAAFDYKLQLGPMEYRDITTGKWLPHARSGEQMPLDPLEVNRKKLIHIQEILQRTGISAKYREYPSFTGRFRPTRQGENLMLDAPLLLIIGRALPLEFYCVLTYDFEKQRYRYDIVRSANLYDMRVQALSQHGVPRFTTPVVVHRRIIETRDISPLIVKIVEQQRGQRH
jgi:arginine-tRNA-protein transferase